MRGDNDWLQNLSRFDYFGTFGPWIDPLLGIIRGLAKHPITVSRPSRRLNDGAALWHANSTKARQRYGDRAAAGLDARCRQAGLVRLVDLVRQRSTYRAGEGAGESAVEFDIYAEVRAKNREGLGCPAVHKREPDSASDG